MDIDWYGHACFRIREQGLAVVTDPYPDELGYTRPRIRADVVTVSHAHEGHSAIKGFRGAPRIFDAPGEYEVGGVFITGVSTFHDPEQGAIWGRNIAFLFDFDGLTVCHLGDLGHLLDQSQIEALDGVNVLMVPVGGGASLGGAQAAEVVGLVEPNIVIPMHYQIPGVSRDLAPVTHFLKAMGLRDVEPQESLRVTRALLSEETQVVLLRHG